MSTAHHSDPIWPCWVKAFDLPLEENHRSGWNIYRVFKGSTSSMSKMRSHVSVLSANKTPHPPHRHPEEELIIMLSGEVDIIRADDPPSQQHTAERIGPGSLVYHCAYQSHTIRSVGAGPATYLIFKWRGEPRTTEGPVLGSATFSVQTGAPAKRSRRSKGFARTRVFKSPTRYLRKLRCHVSVLEPGAGYRPHRDAYDVAIVVFKGTVETLDRQFGPHSVIFYPSQELHGMKNVGTTPASYLVFEFHGTGDRIGKPREQG